jgi:hypothetical protein
MRNLVLGFVLLLTMGDGCGSNVVGVQDYGSITGRVLDATTNRPLPNAFVSVGSLYTVSADPQGAFTMPRVPIGTQTVTARAAGYTTANADIDVGKNHTSDAGYLRLTPVASNLPTLPPPPTPTPGPTPEMSAPPANPTPAPSPT